MPAFKSIGAILFQMATNSVLDTKKARQTDFYLGEADGQHVWLIYKPDIEWLKSPTAALTLELAEKFAAKDSKRRHLVFAPSRYVSQKDAC